MSVFLLLAAPLIAANGVNIGHVYEDCTGKAAKAVLQSSMSDEQIADYAMSKCRNLEPKLREAVEREWRTDRSGQVSGQPNQITQIMTDSAWPKLLKAKRDRLAQAVHSARHHPER